MSFSLTEPRSLPTAHHFGVLASAHYCALDPVNSSLQDMTLAPPRIVHAPRGSSISCRGWVQEAAMRMLMNNLDPEVAERPEDLVVYGGTGRAARSWEAFDAIVRT